jgi:HlyD family secretion protein
MSNTVLSSAKNGWRERLVTVVRSWVRRHPRPAVGIAAGVALVVVLLVVGKLRRAEAVDTTTVADVQRGRLVISITEAGTIRAKDNYEVKCGVEGQSTITFLVPEATQVNEGDLLVSLDSGDLEDRLTQQKLSYEDAKAGNERASKDVEITQSKNESNITKAEQTLEFAKLDLEKWLGTAAKAQEGDVDGAQQGAASEAATAEAAQTGTPGEAKPEAGSQAATAEAGHQGDLYKARQDAANNVRFAEEEKIRADNQYTSTKQLYESNYVNKIELDADELAAKRREAEFDMAKLDVQLLENYTWRKQQKTLESAVEEAGRELGRVNSQALASLAQANAEMVKSQAQLALQQARLTKVQKQVENTKMYAPRAGMVVYPKAEPYRGQQQVMEVGATVRYQQILLQLPDLSELLVNTKVYESEVSKVKVGQQARIRVQALAQVLGEGQAPVLQGEVTKIGILPDYGDRWLNPDQKTFNVSVRVSESRQQIVSQLKPEMTAEVTIILATLDDCLSVPVQAVSKIGEAYFAYMLHRGTPTRVPVSVGLTNAVRAQVLRGLDEGDQVLLYPPAEGEAQLANLGLPRTGVPAGAEGTETTTSTSEGTSAAPAGSASTTAGGPSATAPAAASSAEPAAPAQGAASASGEQAPGGQRPQGADQAAAGAQGPGGGRQPGAGLSAEQQAQLRQQLQNASPEERQRLMEQARQAGGAGGAAGAGGGGGRRRGGGQPGAAGGAGGAGTNQPQQQPAQE